MFHISYRFQFLFTREEANSKTLTLCPCLVHKLLLGWDCYQGIAFGVREARSPSRISFFSLNFVYPIHQLYYFWLYNLLPFLLCFSQAGFQLVKTKLLITFLSTTMTSSWKMLPVHIEMPINFSCQKCVTGSLEKKPSNRTECSSKREKISEK